MEERRTSGSMFILSARIVANERVVRQTHLNNASMVSVDTPWSVNFTNPNFDSAMKRPLQNSSLTVSEPAVYAESFKLGSRIVFDNM